MLYAVLSSLLFFSPISFSAQIVRLTSLDDRSYSLTMRAFRELADANEIEIDIVRVRQVKDVAPEIATLAGIRRRLARWDEIAAKRHWFREAQSTHILTPLIVEENGTWLTGLAAGICDWPSISISNAGIVNHLDQLRIRHSAAGMLHEMLHTVGAEHSESVSLMHPNFLGLLDPYQVWPIPLDSLNRREVRRCLRR